MPFDNHLIKPHSDLIGNSANPYNLDWRDLQPVVGKDDQNVAAGYTTTGGTNEMEFTGVNPDYLNHYLRYMIGGNYHFPLVGANINGNAVQQAEYSGIDRWLPLGHPYNPFMYCTGIPSVKGVSYQQDVSYPAWEFAPIAVPNLGFEAPCFTTFQKYAAYDLKVTFAPRTYDLLLNSTIYDRRAAVPYYVPGSTQVVSVPSIWPEWLRYTFMKVEPKFEMLSAQQGQYSYFTPFPLNAIIRPVTSTGQIKTPYPSCEIKLTWYKVPYSFVGSDATRIYNSKGERTTKTVITYAQHTVNQHDFLGYKAGTLLFHGVSSTEPETNFLPDYRESVAGNGRYVPIRTFTTDITFHFLYREPELALDYQAGGYFPGGPKNSYNNIYYGHNCVPDATTGKYYAAIYTGGGVSATGDIQSASAQNTIYKSFPFELLFTDPSYTMPYLP